MTTNNINIKNQSVTQPWVWSLTFMQQSVLLTAIRGPDGLPKDHITKVLLRWYRRCVLRFAFQGTIFTDPYDLDGGSFTGPSPMNIDMAVDEYLRHLDETPHHFQLHFIHAVEVLGYKHPDTTIREWWYGVYIRLVNDMHLFPEPEDIMDQRLGDNKDNCLKAEEVLAKNAGI